MWTWNPFSHYQPNRHDSVLVWCGHERCVKHIEDFRSEEASNNWLLWTPCPRPTPADIELADRLEEASILAGRSK